MKRKQVAKVVAVASVLGLSMLFNSGMSQPIQAHAESNATQQMVVVYKNADGKNAVLKQSQKVDRQFKSVSAMSVKLTQKEIDNLKANPNVASVEPNIKFTVADSKHVKHVKADGKRTSTTTTPPTEDSYWDLQATNAPNAWKDGYTGAGVKVAVIDTGIAPHPDLNIAGGVSFVDYTTSYVDDDGHGTNVAGIIGAKHNGVGTVGVSPDVSLYAVKVLDNTGSGTLTDVMEGIDWAITNHMNIINMSLGTTTDSQALHDMVDKAYNNGVLVVSASGNNGNKQGTGDTVNYPAKYDHVISVSAVDSSLKRASFSSTGDRIDFSAGGMNIKSTYLNGQYATMSGTSQATPHVTGIFALLKQEYPSYTNDQLVSLEKTYVKDLGVQGKDTWYGYGLARYLTAPTM